MHTVHLLAQAVELARQVGYQVREEPLEGAGGGHCLVRGKKWLLLDLTQSAEEQLSDTIDALTADSALDMNRVPASLLSRMQPVESSAG